MHGLACHLTQSDLTMDENDIQDYDVLNQLAKGGQVTTSRVRRKRDNTIWVMKESYVDNTKAGNSALREAKTLQSLNHPFINRYQDVFLNQDGGQLVRHQSHHLANSPMGNTLNYLC